MKIYNFLYTLPFLFIGQAQSLDAALGKNSSTNLNPYRNDDFLIPSPSSLVSGFSLDYSAQNIDFNIDSSKENTSEISSFSTYPISSFKLRSSTNNFFDGIDGIFRRKLLEDLRREVDWEMKDKLQAELESACPLPASLKTHNFKPLSPDYLGAFKF